MSEHSDSRGGGEAKGAQLEGYPVVIRFPVVWGDMDAFAHLNNTVYIRYFESARMVYFERMKILDGVGEPAGPGPILAKIACRYKAPIKYPDTVVVGCRVAELGEDHFKTEYAVYSERLGRVAAEGEGRLVSYDYKEGKKVALPESWRVAIRSIEGTGHRG